MTGLLDSASLSAIRWARFFVLMVASVCLASSGLSAETDPGSKLLGKGTLPIAIDNGQLIQLGNKGRISISGRNLGSTPAKVYLRVDDRQTPPYADRFNDERQVQPGPFTWNVPISALKTPGGRKLDLQRITRILLFKDDAGPEITVFSFRAPGTQIAQNGASDAPAKTAPKGPAVVQIGTGSTPLSLVPRGGTDLRSYDEIVIEGVAKTDTQVGLVLRVDDAASSNYPSRFNQERMLPAGPFRYSVGIRGLRASNKRFLDLSDIRKILLFNHGGEGTTEITRFELRRAPTLPAGVAAYAFGAAQASLPPGFKRLDPNSAEIKGLNLRARSRPMPDPLVANGIEGIARVTLKAKPGRYRVSIWSEDPGEWSILPSPLRRSIRVNGTLFLEQNLTAEQWIRDRYLRGKRREHTSADNAWTAFGQYRGNLVSKIVEVKDGNLNVTLDGDRSGSFYLSAIVVEPENSRVGLDFAQDFRRNWYVNNWPVASPKLASAPLAHPVRLTRANATRKPIRVTSAADAAVRISVSVSTDVEVRQPKVTVSAPSRGSVSLPVKIWSGIRKFSRPQGFNTTLSRSDDFLMSDVGSWPIRSDEPRTYELWVTVSPDAAPGVYSGVLSVSGAGVAARVPFEVNVLPLKLPPAPKPAGFYLAAAHHLNYFRRLQLQVDRQAACDLKLMASFGLRGSAPPLRDLNSRTVGLVRSDIQRASNLGVVPGFLAYNPIERLRVQAAHPVAAKTVSRAMRSIRGAGVRPPLWSAADEPSNADRGTDDLKGWVEALRSGTPGIRLGGHLNSPSDRAFAALFDTIIINPGFGVDVNDIAEQVRAGREVWFYNTFKPRLTSGFWLWRTEAERYVQWHARMPTSDPFDPLDGREGDFSMILPDTQLCREQPDIHRDILEMAQGMIDQRWLTWLSNQTSPDARRLSAKLRTLFRGQWQLAAKADLAIVQAIRDEVIDVYMRRRGTK